MSTLPEPQEARPAEASPSAPPALPIGGPDTRIMSAVSWIFLGLGVIAFAIFLRDPSVPRHPDVFLLGITGIVGSGTLRILARLLRDRPVD